MYIQLKLSKNTSTSGFALALAALVMTTASAGHARTDIANVDAEDAYTSDNLMRPQLIDGQPMTMDQIEAKLRQHPSLESLSFTALANRERANAALGLPDPIVSLQLNNFPVLSPSFTEYLPTNRAVGIRQAFPSRAERNAKSTKSLRNADQVDAERNYQFDRLRGRVLALLIGRAALDEQRTIAAARDAKYDELTEIIDIEINAGRPLVFRLAQVDVERSEVSRTLADLNMQREVIDAQLIELLGTVPQVTLPEMRRTPWPDNALSLHAVRVADAGVEIASADIDIAEADFKPDWGANITYQQRESGKGPRSNFDGDDWVSGGVSFTIPLWASKKQEPALRAAKADLSAARARRSSVARQIRSEWRRLEARADVAVENINILETQIAATNEQTDAQLISYESGQGDYSAIIDSEIAVFRLQADMIKEGVRRDQTIAIMNSLLVTP